MGNKNKEEIKYYWLEFAQSFLLLAKLACQELEDKRKDKYSKTTRYDPPEFYLPYIDSDLFIPIIFNIKHGLEIFIKTLMIMSIGSYKPGHDIKELFNDLKSILPNKKEQLIKLEDLILKYYYCRFLNNNKKKVVNIYDEMNDVFRYPENKARVKIDLELVNGHLIKMVHKDIDQIYRLFNDLGYEIDSKL